MPVTYRDIAGVSLARLTALSDGIFAVAMTLLVLGLTVRVGQVSNGATEGAFWTKVLVPLWPHLLTYVMSFVLLGTFWVGQLTQLHYLHRADRDFTWIHLILLLFVVLLPFSTTVVADYITFGVAILIYWLNIALCLTTLYTGLRYAIRAHLIRRDVTADTIRAMKRRLLVYQALYAAGALLAAVSTYASIAFIVTVQLAAAITPRIPLLERRLRPAPAWQ